MEFVGWGLLIILLPFAIIYALFSVIIPLTSNCLKIVKKETKEKLENEQNKILREISEKGESISDEEKQEHCKRIGDIMEEGRRKVRCAIDKEFGIDDMSRGHKEIMDELKTNDLRNLIK